MWTAIAVSIVAVCITVLYLVDRLFIYKERMGKVRPEDDP